VTYFFSNRDHNNPVEEVVAPYGSGGCSNLRACGDKSGRSQCPYYNRIGHT